MEDRKVSIPSYDLFPTIPLTFDGVYWEAYWPIVNEQMLDVREVMIKLEKEEKRMKEMSEKKWKLEREEAERLEAQKKNKRSLDLGRWKNV